MEQTGAGQKEKIKNYLPLYNRIITEFERPFCQISRILSDDEQDGLFYFPEKEEKSMKEKLIINTNQLR